MRSNYGPSFAFAAGFFSLSAVSAQQPLSLLVDDTPTHVRPYVLPHLVGKVTATGDMAYRFPITAASSGNAFTLLTTNTGRYDKPNVFPHAHKVRYENFFCEKGALNLWLATNDTSQEARVMEPGDFGASPPGKIHAFQTLRPDTEMFGVVFPGGLEDLFYTIGQNFSYPASATYDALARGGGPPGGTADLKAVEKFDIFAQPNFIPRTDITNGSAPASDWHVKPEPLPKDSSAPFFLGKNFGPKYLNSENGYTIISPLNTLARSAPYNFTLSFLTLSKPKDLKAVPWRTFTEHGAFRIQEGALSLQVEGYGDPVQLLPGDVAFLPQGTKYKFHAIVPATKTLYVAAGGKGLDAALLSAAKTWEYPTWPVGFV